MSLTTNPTTANPAVRNVGGVDLPAAGTYALDVSHSEVGFAVRHLMVSKTRGRFSDFAGTVEIAENPLESSVAVTIQTASVDTRDEQRDGHLRSGDFFDAEAWPTMSYQSRSVREAGKGRYILEGDLTIKGVTQPVPLELSFEGGGTDPWGGVRVGFSAKAELDREAFGLTWNQALETGGVVVGKKVTIEIEAEAVKQA
ncbi:MAG TPA: YceI family protein [Acidimicrobiia bacterium]|nr:YceI family protein [Acidimicrobiia bacterium]